MSDLETLRAALAASADNRDAWFALLDELDAFRAKAALASESYPPVDHDDLPPDAPTGLYLDRPFDIDDLGWLKMAMGRYYGDSETSRSGQIMLVFQSIRRDERATTEFLRVMNTLVLPLCRRIRLHELSQLRERGAANGGSK